VYEKINKVVILRFWLYKGNKTRRPIIRKRKNKTRWLWVLAYYMVLRRALVTLIIINTQK
jgi:hypothetical protein